MMARFRKIIFFVSKRFSETDVPDAVEAEEEPKKDLRLLVKTKENDPNNPAIRARQKLVAEKSPAQLSEIRGFGDFPVPTLFKARDRSSSKDPKRYGNQGFIFWDLELNLQRSGPIRT